MKIVILDVRSARILLHTEVTQPTYGLLGQFSPDGCFFACNTSKNEICIWKKTPTSYVPWSNLQPRLRFEGFAFSPAVTSILTWGQEGIQLLHLENSASPLFPNEIEPCHGHGNHLVTYPTDRMHIAIARQEDGMITVLNSLSGIPQQSINTGIEIQDIRIVSDTIFAVGKCKLVRWDLETGASMPGAYDTEGEAINERLAIGADLDAVEHFRLSNDCSKIAFSIGHGVFLYDIKSQEINKYMTLGRVIGIWFSPDGHQLGFIADRTQSHGIVSSILDHEPVSYFTQLEIAEKHLVIKATQDLVGQWSWVKVLQSPHGYHIGSGSRWVEDSGGRKLLWLPPSWRARSACDIRWEGNSLALVDGHHLEPIIIEFQPTVIPSPPAPNQFARYIVPLSAPLSANTLSHRYGFFSFLRS